MKNDIRLTADEADALLEVLNDVVAPSTVSAAGKLQVKILSTTGFKIISRPAVLPAGWHMRAVSFRVRSVGYTAMTSLRQDGLSSLRVPGVAAAPNIENQFAKRDCSLASSF